MYSSFSPESADVTNNIVKVARLPERAGFSAAPHYALRGDTFERAHHIFEISVLGL